jgi:hypothetical protein
MAGEGEVIARGADNGEARGRARGSEAVGVGNDGLGAVIDDGESDRSFTHVDARGKR